MALERYKLIYSNNLLIRIIEVTDENGVLRPNPIAYTPSSPGWNTLVSGIIACTDEVRNLEVIQNCLFDNTTGDYLNMVPFVRYVTIDVVTGELDHLGDYRFVPTGIIPYSVIGPVIASAGDEVKSTKGMREVLNGSGSWSIADHPQTFSLVLNVVSGSPTLQDGDGNVTNLFQNESVPFVAATDGAGVLTETFIISASTGDVVSINWMELAT